MSGTWNITGDFSGGSGGNLFLNGGTVTFNSGASFSPLTTLTVAGGTQTFNTGTTVTPTNWVVSGATLTGSDSFALGSRRLVHVGRRHDVGDRHDDDRERPHAPRQQLRRDAPAQDLERGRRHA